MAVSRPILLALLGAVLVGALFFATMGARQSSEQPSETPAPRAEKAAPKDRAKTGERALAATARPARPTPRPRAVAPTGVPTEVTRALSRGRTVVLFFFQRGSADDDATAQAVSALRGRKEVEVFSAPISRLAAYRAVTGGAGVSRAPSVVILGGKGSARVIEGFVDRETLAQEVSDSR